MSDATTREYHVYCRDGSRTTIAARSFEVTSAGALVFYHVDEQGALIPARLFSRDYWNYVEDVATVPPRTFPPPRD